MFDAASFFRAVIIQDEGALKGFFHEDAWVEWPCTNEHFTAAEYIRANCEYPGDWLGEIERCERLPEGLMMAARVWPKDQNGSFHAVSLITLRDDKIVSMVEYWADDAPAPEWRQKMRIGRPIR